MGQDQQGSAQRAAGQPNRHAAREVIDCHDRRWVAQRPLLSGVIAAIMMLTPPAIAQTRIYNPLAITPGKSLTDKLTRNDIPTGQGGFARDYVVQLQAGNQITVDVSSESFDSIVYLIAADGTTIAENDDGPDGSTNSVLFTRIAKTGLYTVRVRSFGDAAGGNFTLKVTLLKPQ